METLFQKILRWIFMIMVSILAIIILSFPIYFAITETIWSLLIYLVLIPIYSVALYFLIDEK